MRPSRFLLVVLGALAAGQMAYYRTRLPERVASHFDIAGRPDGWMERDAFVVFWAVMVAGLMALVLGIAWGASRLPASLHNIPNRDYWFAPERRDETCAIIGQHLEWIAVFVLALMAGAFQLTVAAHERTPPSLPDVPFWTLLVLTVGGVLWVTLRMNRRFRSAPGVEDQAGTGSRPLG